MADGPPKRARPVRKTLSFTPQEWERIERRMTASEATSFTSFAREAVLEGRVVVRPVTIEADALRVELSRIGNNVNQIARQVNTEREAGRDDVASLRQLLREIQALLTAATRE